FDQKVLIHYSRMSEGMQQDAVNVAFLALTKYNTARAVASCIKEAFDKKYRAAWQCVVGHHINPIVDFREGNFIHFKLGQTTILLFRAT
ncbi:dynein light chain, putative, partial [Ixodes scapularis]